MTNLVRYQQPSALTRFQPTTLAEIQSIAQIFYESGLFVGENSTKQSVAALAVKILAGQELGFTPFAAANGMQIIKGKCAPGANLMAAKVKASGRYSYLVTKMTDTEVSIDFYEGDKKIGVSSFTAQDAQKAGTQNMGKFPRNMLFARAMSNGVRWYTPDIFNGVAVYTAEELGASVDYETGEVTGLPIEEVNFMDDGQGGTEKATEKATFPRVDEKTLKRLHVIGTQIYGNDWDATRPVLVENITHGDATSSKELTPGEANELMLTILGQAAFGVDWGSKVDQVCRNAEVKGLRFLKQVDVNNLIKRLETALASQAAGQPVAVGK